LPRRSPLFPYTTLFRSQVIPDCGPILVVDDDATFCDLVTTLVDRIGYAAVAARDGEEALETARSSNPSLVVLDVDLPGISGYEVDRKSTRLNSSHVAIS